MPAHRLSLFTIRHEAVDQPDILTLLEKLDAYQSALYPAECCHFTDLRTVPADELIFLVIRHRDGHAVGCGALWLRQPGEGEMKRIYVEPTCRGSGAADQLMRQLEQQARLAGCQVIRLETGIHQPQAIRLYQRHGYRLCGPFFPYGDDPLSVYMEKMLTD
ncbi:GNAT family N-acetyltransferase [Dickeya sp. CFBP 2040]|uniref:GNAT family N-acetyltransferase n=1 Tax=Dickeya poaceiphila TaxID=568768 RepID=A0A5B8HSA0_9GAMM|nr:MULTISPECIES: GNAT family N-acetyltransferase [Dickeya]NKI76307.1 GNAT family N-acetyltransferase [Dickeya sp. CFBP 2040]QDX31246.1 GNAT family N-acetyltransferase [Dickeya poaceiphila]